MWAQMRTAVDEAIRKRITDFSGWKLSGDTILAAQWHHRKSTDVDLKVGAKTGLAILDPRYDPSFDQEMKELGAGQPIHRQDQIIIPGSAGRSRRRRGRDHEVPQPTEQFAGTQGAARLP